MKKTAFLFFLFFLNIGWSIAQSFLNGSFENCSLTTCQTSLNNATYNSHMTDVTGFGVLETLDIFYDIDCFSYGTAQNGHYYTSVEKTNNPISTAIALKLSSTLLIGQVYSFSFYDKSLFTMGGPIEIGISANDSTFGTLIYTTPNQAPIDVWTQRNVSFTAPLTGQYITARYKISNGFNGVFIDNFHGLTLDLHENILEDEVSIYPNPSDGIFNLSVTNETEIEIYESVGNCIYKTKASNQTVIIDLSREAKGFYFVKLTDEKKTFYKKIIFK